MFNSSFRFSALLSVALLAIVGLSASPADAQVTLRFNGWLPPAHPIMRLSIRPWAEEISKVTGGRVKVEFTASSLGPPNTQIDMVRDGVVDAALTVHGYTPGRFELTRVAELPFLSRGAEALSVALWRVHSEMLTPADEHKGIKLLTMFTSQPGIVYSKGKKLDSIQAWTGVKIAGGSKINADIAALLGASPIQVPGPQIYELLERGVADAGFLDQSSYKDFNLGRVVDSAVTFPQGIYAVTFFVAANEAAWNKIAPADRAAIEAISGEALARKAGANWDSEAKIARDQMIERKTAITEAGGDYLAELKRRLAPLETAWIDRAKSRGVDGAAVLKRLRAVVADYEK